jgi:hypothetical protein
MVNFNNKNGEIKDELFEYFKKIKDEAIIKRIFDEVLDLNDLKSDRIVINKDSFKFFADFCELYDLTKTECIKSIDWDGIAYIEDYRIPKNESDPTTKADYIIRFVVANDKKYYVYEHENYDKHETFINHIYDANKVVDVLNKFYDGREVTLLF